MLLLLFSHPVVSDSFATPWTIAHQAPLSTEFPKQKYWSGVPFPSLGGIFPTQGLNSGLLHWQARSLPLSHLGSGLSDTNFGWVYSAIPVESLDSCFLAIFLKMGGGVS